MAKIRVFYGHGENIPPTGMAPVDAPILPEAVTPADSGDLDVSPEFAGGGDSAEAIEDDLLEVEGQASPETPNWDWTIPQIDAWASAQDPVLEFSSKDHKSDKLSAVERYLLDQGE